MPLFIRFNQARNTVTVAATGEITGSEICRMLGALNSDCRLRPEMSVLWDFRMAHAPLRRHDIQKIIDVAKSAPGRRGRGKTGIVAPNDLEFGLARMLQAYADDLPEEVGVYRDAEEAERWLDDHDHWDSLAG